MARGDRVGSIDYRAPLMAVSLAGLLLGGWSGPVAAGEAPPRQEVELLLPDLITLAPTDLRLVVDRARGRRFVRFSNTVANVGAGPLELRGLPARRGSEYQVTQQLYGSHGEVLAEPVLSAIIYHPVHGHWHLAGFARYELWSVGVGGRLEALLRTSDKISYCMMDTDRLDPESDEEPAYRYCGPSRQGLSAGWSDHYGSNLAGQWVDVSDVPAGTYALRSSADPSDYLTEVDEHNNAAFVYIQLTADSVSVVELAAAGGRPEPADPCRDPFGHPIC